MIKKIHYFNMIEVLLALTVIAIGMTSIMGLFPVGLKASRGAVAENSSANVADQMVTYMRVMGESSDSAYDATFDYDNVPLTTDLPVYDNDNASTDNTDDDNLDIYTSGDVTTINLQDSSDVNIQTLSNSFLTAYKTDKVATNNNTAVDGIVFRRVASNWAIFTKDPSAISGLRRRVYFIVQGPNCTENGGNRNIDYSAMALVWKSPIQVVRLITNGVPTNSADWQKWPSDTDIADPTKTYDYSGKINVELSWPLILPYSQRKKRYYQVVINKP